MTPNLATTVLLSLIYSDREEVEDEGLNVNTVPCFVLPPTWPFPCVGTFTTTDQQVFTGDRETLQGEGQYIYQAERLNVTAGALYADNNNSGSLVSTATTSFPLPPSIVTVNLSNKTDISGLYAYGNLSTRDDMEWTIGLSYTDYDIDFDDQVIADEDFDRFNPKLGLRWNLTDALDLRAAWFRSVMPLLANKRLLEPTQVAGFSQFYDEASGTRADTYAAGLDLRVSERLHLGGESVRRELETPSTFYDSLNNLGFVVFEDRDEWRHSLYAYWLPHDHWSLSAEAVYDEFESADSIVNVNLPTKAKTWSVPLKASYFHPSGFFGLLGVTYVDQEIERQALASEATGDDEFVLTDLAVGYRLSKRRGILSVAVQNLFDEDFNYQDDSYRTFEDEPTIGPYIPERTVMLRMTLNF
jgi:outer membrane receptor protein involved in Fe transport